MTPLILPRSLQQLSGVLLQSITPAQRQASALERLQAQVFLLLSYLTAGLMTNIALGLFLVTHVSDLIFAVLPLWPTALYARLGAFRRGRWLFVLSGTAAALGVGLLSKNLFVGQMVLLQLMLLTAVGNVTLSLRGLILVLISLLVGTSAMLGVWPAVPRLQGMGAALITVVIALLLTRLMWRPLSALFQAALNAELNEAMSAVKNRTTGFIYRLSLVDERLTLDFVFGSPENTVAQTPEQLITAGGWEAYLHPDDHDLLQAHWQQALADGQHTVEYRLRASSAHPWL